tara:strand:- start:564 stop:1304 length:741 start_codon:yes stop_codon:yes gene_type:complete
VSDRWPEWIPKESRRAWLTSSDLNKLLMIDGIYCYSYISRQERLGKPIKHKIYNVGKRYRILDVIARARAEAVSIGPSTIIKEKMNVDFLIEKRDRLEQEVMGLDQEITDLLDKRDAHCAEFHFMSDALTGKHMLIEREIAKVALPIDTSDYCGVYFLVKGDRVVYVGQSIHIQMRVREHAKDKDFDSFSFIRCEKKRLNVLESLYIHALRPEYQGKSGTHGHLAAPYSFNQLVEMTHDSKERLYS